MSLKKKQHKIKIRTRDKQLNKRRENYDVNCDKKRQKQQGGGKENSKEKKTGYWLVDVALEGSCNHKVTMCKRGFDDSVSKLQHVHGIVHHVLHLRK